MVLKLFFQLLRCSSPELVTFVIWRVIPERYKGHIFSRQSLLRGDPSKNTMKVFCLLVVVGIACAAPERGKSNQYNICI